MADQPRSATTASLIAWAGALAFAASLGYFLHAYLVRFGTRVESTNVLAPVLVNGALFSAFALHHSLFARAGPKALMHRLVPPALERSVYTWIASLLFAAVCALWMPVPGTLYTLTGPWAVAGYAVQLAGLVLTLRGAAAVDVLDLAGVRPVLDAAGGSRRRHVPLETSGLYGFVRHPLYFAWVLLVWGAPDMTATRACFAAISTLYLALAIPLEERSLVEVFGRDYDEYRRRVRWRMLPGIY